MKTIFALLPYKIRFLHVFLPNLKHVLFFLKTPYYDDHQIFNIEKKICKSYFEAQISRFSRFFALFTKVVLAKKNKCYPRRDNIFCLLQKSISHYKYDQKKQKLSNKKKMLSLIWRQIWADFGIKR